MTMPQNNFNPNSAKANLHTSDHPRHRRMLEELISLYQDKEASPAEQISVKHYLDTCAECRRLLAEYSQVGVAMRGYLDNIPAPRPIVLPTQVKPGQRVVNPAAPLIERQASRRPILREWLSPMNFGRMSGALAAILVGIGLLTLILVYRAGSNNGDAGPTTPPVAGQVDLTATEPPTATPAPSPTATLTRVPTTTEAALQPSQAAPAVPPQPQTTQSQSNNGNSSGSNPAPAQTTIIAQGGGNPPPVAAQPPTNTPKPAAPATTTIAPRPSTAPATATTASVVTTTQAVASTTAAVASPSPATPALAIDTPLAITPTATTEAPAVPTTAAPPTAAAPTTAAPVVVTTPAVSLVTPPPASSIISTTQTLPPAPANSGSNVPGWIAYVSTQDGEIHLINSDGTGDVALSKNSTASNLRWQELVWSHDGNWIAAVAANSGTNSDAIYLYRSDDRNLTKPNFVAEGFAPIWSPDDRFIAYLAGPTRAKNGLKAGKPSVINLKKRETQPPVALAQEYQTIAPQWFEDGNRLLVGQNEIIAPEGTPLQTLDLPYENTCIAPSLSPFGNKLAILDMRGSVLVFDLNKSSFDKNKPMTRIPVTPPGKIGINCGATRLNWTPSGRSVFFYANDGNDVSCVVSVSGAGASCLSGVYAPSFTVSGGHLVDFNPNARGQFYAFAFGSKPTTPRPLAASRVPPAWQPHWS